MSVEVKRFRVLPLKETVEKLNRIVQATQIEELAEFLVDKDILVRKAAKKKLERLKPNALLRGLKRIRKSF